MLTDTSEIGYADIFMLLVYVLGFSMLKDCIMEFTFVDDATWIYVSVLLCLAYH